MSEVDTESAKVSQLQSVGEFSVNVSDSKELVGNVPQADRHSSTAKCQLGIKFLVVVLALAVVSLCLSSACLVLLLNGPRHRPSSISVFVNNSAIGQCALVSGVGDGKSAARRGGRLLRIAAAAAGYLGPRPEQLHLPCMAEDGLMFTAADAPLGPLVCGVDGAPRGMIDCQQAGFQMTDNRDGIIVQEGGVYAAHSTVTFYDSDASSYSTFSVTVNDNIRLDCASHNAHNEAKNPLTVCALNGLLDLNRGDIVRFTVRSNGRKINLHRPATHFSMYRVA